MRIETETTTVVKKAKRKRKLSPQYRDPKIHAPTVRRRMEKMIRGFCAGKTMTTVEIVNLLKSCFLKEESVDVGLISPKSLPFVEQLIVNSVLFHMRTIGKKADFGIIEVLDKLFPKEEELSDVESQPVLQEETASNGEEV